ncbi:MAG: cyclodeaminase [Pseudomonadota bacterium]
MPTVNILNENDLRQCIALDTDAVSCMENCFRTLATEPVIMPPIMRLDIPQRNAEIDVKTAYLPGVDSFAIKISPGFFENPKIGLPSVSGMMNLFSAHTGLLEAVLLDNGYLTNVRTAAAGAVAAKWLSRGDSRSVGIIGAGVQAGLQLEAVTLVRNIQQARIWARDLDKAQKFCESMSAKLDLEIDVAESPADACVSADIVLTTTPSTTPLIEFSNLSPGQHVTAMGSDAEHKNEINPDIVSGANYLCDRLTQVKNMGELHHAIEAGAVREDHPFSEIGEVIAGRITGRKSAEDITVCDLTGTGAQDTAIAALARERSEASEMGITISN